MPNLYFKVNAELKSVIGKDLINNDNVAVIELVKNSYDADAENILIEFDCDNKILIIADNGHGMTLADLNDKWLNIAHSEKKSKKGKRINAGNKGVGRFSCDRLGDKLSIYTVAKNHNPIRFDINWNDFETNDSKSLMTDIPIEYTETTIEQLKKLTRLNINSHGTVLIIENLRASWDNESLSSLRKELGKFANPHQDVQLNAFIIDLVCKGNDINPSLTGVIKNTILADTIEKTSYIRSNLKDKEIRTTLFYKGQELVTIYEKSHYEDLDNITIELVFLGTYEKAFFTRRMGFKNQDYGSIFLFVNGFRISPFGDPDNDWLGIDRRHAQGVMRFLAARDLMGRVEVQDNNENWVVVSNREGIVKNNAYGELTRDTKGDWGYFHKVFRKLENYIKQGLDWEGSDDKDLYNKLVKSKNISKQDVNFRLNDSEREAQLLSTLSSIITTGTSIDDIIKIEFNDKLVDILKQQHEKLLNAFYSDMEAFLAKSVDCRSFSENILNLKEITTKARENEIKYQEALKKAAEANQKAEEERELTRKAELARYEAEKREKEAQDKAQKADVARRKADAEKQKAHSEKATIEAENLFLQANLATDIKGLAETNHQIHIWAESIEYTLKKVSEKLEKEQSIDERVAVLTALTLCEKIKAVSSVISSQNLRINSIERRLDIISFIKDYIANPLIDIQEKTKKIQFHDDLPSDQKFTIPFKPIEISIVLDNLTHNSIKAKAQNIYISIVISNDDRLIIDFKDDGAGLSDSITHNDDIFTMGITTTGGAGIGLSHVKRIVEKSLKGTVTLLSKEKGFFVVRIILPRR